MTPREKSLIKAEWFDLWHREFAELKRELEYAHQAIDEKDEVIGIANNELRNAMGDSHQASFERSYRKAKLKLAHGRRHLYRARRILLSTAVVAIEAKIFKWMREAPVRSSPEYRGLRKRANQLRADRRKMPKIRGAVEGGTLADVQRKTLRLRRECLDWKRLLYRAGKLYDEVTD